MRPEGVKLLPWLIGAVDLVMISMATVLAIRFRVSLPIFDNFQREQHVEEASAARNNAQFAIRAQELKTTATVTSSYLTLQAQAQQVALQERTAQQAREALRLAEERYRVGLAPNAFSRPVSSRSRFTAT